LAHFFDIISDLTLIFTLSDMLVIRRTCCQLSCMETKLTRANNGFRFAHTAHSITPIHEVGDIVLVKGCDGCSGEQRKSANNCNWMNETTESTDERKMFAHGFGTN